MKNIITILNVQNECLKDGPSHLKFASDYFARIAPIGNKQVKVINYYFKTDHSKKSVLIQNICITIKALTISHDILYYGTDPTNLFLLAMLKNIRLYRKKMCAWKYIALYKPNNIIKALIKKNFYKAFDCIFMVTESHVEESIMSGMTTKEKCKYIKWGEDISYIDSINPTSKNSKKLTFISTGKAYRDFDTLCKAFIGVDAMLKIFVPKKWGDINYQIILDKYKTANNIRIFYIEDIVNNKYQSILDYLYAELKSADASVVICKKVNFGVGFTAILDAMVCSKPIIATFHKDNPINIDDCKIGCTVRAESVELLKEKIIFYSSNQQELRICGNNGRKLIESEYNIERVARDVVSIMQKLCEDI